MNRKIDVLDRDFAEARACLLDLAAFIDRVERAEGKADFRWTALLEALPLLGREAEGNRTGRTRLILERLSWPGEEPTVCVAGKSACGAPDLPA